jgi:murein DD-endopeptidase MepM/ murein hydrolase activator NlpD
VVWILYRLPEKMRFTFALFLLMMTSCTSQRGLFTAKSPHKQYEENLKDAGLHETAMGRSWITAAEKSLGTATRIRVPFTETGYFEPGKPSAAGYIFPAKRGEKLVIQTTRKPKTGFLLFVELWQRETEGNKLVTAADTLLNTIEHEVREEGNYLVRVQPELLGGGEFSITITTTASLAFPVSNTKARVGSFWGDARDAGARSHEGVDIFGSFRTPVVAAADGYISSVAINNLGGKVIFMRPSGKDYSLYYAHLDSQIVSSGQRVRTGEVLGLMGNTGNARNTPTHLHFGIYTGMGPVDPLPFIQQDRPKPASITASVSRLNDFIRTGKNAWLYEFPGADAAQGISIPANTLVQVIAATDGYYKVRLPDDAEKFILHTQTSSAETAIRSVTLLDDTPLLDKPDSAAAKKTTLAKGEKIKVNAMFSNFYYVTYNNTDGWVPVSAGK